MSRFPDLPHDDSREKLLEDLEYGGMYGYAMARGVYDRYPSTLEFEDAVLKDVMERCFAIAEMEHDEIVGKFERLICELSHGKISKSGADYDVIKTVIEETFEDDFDKALREDAEYYMHLLEMERDNDE